MRNAECALRCLIAANLANQSLKIKHNCQKAEVLENAQHLEFERQLISRNHAGRCKFVASMTLISQAGGDFHQIILPAYPEIMLLNMKLSPVICHSL
jgi:hypothetical protein